MSSAACLVRQAALPSARRPAGQAGAPPACCAGRRQFSAACPTAPVPYEHGLRDRRSARRRSACRLLEVRAAAAAEHKEGTSSESFYAKTSPLLSLNLKKARKMAKRLDKQRKALLETAEMFPMAPGVVESMIAELDKASVELDKRIEQLKAEEPEKDSSSSSSEDEGKMGIPDETDAAVVLERLRLERSATSSLPAGAASSGMAVCAMSVEDIPQAATTGRVFVCQGKACMKQGAGFVLDRVNGARSVQAGAVKVVACGCLGKCKQGAAIRVKAGADKPELITRIDSEQVDEFMQFKFD